MKGKKLILFVVGLSLCFSLYYFCIYNSTTDLNVNSSYISYDDINELDKVADLIIVASTDQNFENRLHKAKYFSDGALEDFYSVTNVKVYKVLKGADGIKNGSDLNIIEPASLIQTATGKQRLLRDDYQPLEKNKHYILFLKKNDSGQYSIINMNLGKFDLSYKNLKLNTATTTDKFMEDVFEKYKSELSEY